MSVSAFSVKADSDCLWMTYTYIGRASTHLVQQEKAILHYGMFIKEKTKCFVKYLMKEIFLLRFFTIDFLSFSLLTINTTYLYNKNT